MFGGLQRHVHAGQACDFACPHARAVDHDLSGDVALVGLHPGDTPAGL